MPVEKFIFLYNITNFTGKLTALQLSSQFLKQLFLRTLTGWFSICIHECGVSSDLIKFASLKKRKSHLWQRLSFFS